MTRSQARGPGTEPARESPPAALADRLGFLLKHAYLAYQSMQTPALAPLGLDGRLLAVLTLVEAEGPALQQRLSERLRVDRTTMVALVDALERNKLVERRRDPVDRRGYQVRITKRGAEALLQGHRAVRTVEQALLGELSDEEQRQLRSLLGRVVLAPVGHPSG
ncbi:MAG: MarR family winged helix-turn-helix transcriptional regulator [Candidatus Dormibacteraceae bacterium]